MCYDISFTVDTKQLSDYFPDLIFDQQIEINFQPVHIIGHAYEDHPIIYKSREDNTVHCKLMEWGCIPFFIKDEDDYKKQRAAMLNARSERILGDKSSYWHKIRNRRCLVPMTGFYEHRHIKGWTKKIPYFITVKDQPLFFIPGLYSVVVLPDKQTGEMIEKFTFTIITRQANSLMKEIHNGGENKGRMPLIVSLAFAEKWLDNSLAENDYSAILNFELPSTSLDYRTVFSIRTSQTRPDEKLKNDLYEWENLKPIVVD